MEDFISLVLIVLIVLMPLGLFGLVTYLLLKIPKYGRYLCAVLYLVVGYNIVLGIWPLNDFYIDEFNRYGEGDLPLNTTVVFKDSSYPNFHGDYYSEAIFKDVEFDYSNFLINSRVLNCYVPEVFKRNFGCLVEDMICWEKNLSLDQRFKVIYSDRYKALYYYYSQN